MVATRTNGKTLGNGGQPRKRQAPRPVERGERPLYDDDRMAAEEFREEFRDMEERGTSVRAFSGGLPTLGRRRR
ncbi:hypothetical protein [Streptomyces sp. JJ36]|uniref:hypothetical protein n=1 Tax=Streptomyces sp. JJ36 TaxID=2736645 RepID=UPI001F398B56|nr:hypothetical protein [Streptomyces sp. JJ36]MCF6521748.1 hypothetical protein [Streptomyces sp. JJ36]